MPDPETRGSRPIEAHRRSAPHRMRRQVHPEGGPKDLCFRTCPRRGAVKAPRHLSPALRGPSHDGKAAGLLRPVGWGRFGMLRMPRGRTLGSDTFTLHDVEQHALA